MGLDMYLEGEKYLWHGRGDTPEIREDGYRLTTKTLLLGYWRKHPNLHGYIVNNFADGVDNCERIFLENTDIEKIIEAVARDDLPHTEGFFFGASDGTEKEQDLYTLRAALDWVRTKEDMVHRSIYYRASW